MWIDSTFEGLQDGIEHQGKNVDYSWISQAQWYRILYQNMIVKSPAYFLLLFWRKKMIFWISIENWVWSYGFQSFSSTFIFSINCRTPFSVGSKLNLTEIQFLWSPCLRNLVLWSFHNWKINFHLFESNHNEIRFLTLPWRWVRQLIEKMNVEENDWKPYDHTQFWMLIQNIMFFSSKQQKKYAGDLTIIFWYKILCHCAWDIHE